MKKVFGLFKENSSLLMIIVMLMCALFGVSGAMTADTVAVTPVNEGLNLPDTRSESPNLVLDQIDKEVVKVRPMNVVLDTIGRNVKSVTQSKSQEIRHYAIDAIDLTTTLNTAHIADNATQIALDLKDNTIVANDQTLICIGVKGFIPGTSTQSSKDLILYVTGKNDAGQPIVKAVNGSGSTGIIPAIPKDTVIMRAGRALSQTQLQTDAYSGNPTDVGQYMQKFGAQIEEDTLRKIVETEVDWTFSDIEEEAIYDMRRTQNVSYWLGEKNKLHITNSRSKKAEDIYFTEGIWSQAGKQIALGRTTTTLTSADLVKLMKHTFTGNESGTTKLIIYGSDFLEAVENVEFTRNVTVGTKSQAYGLEFSSIISKFGTLQGIHDKTLDDMGMADKAFILDADFLRKWTMGWQVKDLDFKSNGEKDVDGRSLIEISALVLKNPNAHSRVALGDF
jgi:hypothetical protein